MKLLLDKSLSEEERIKILNETDKSKNIEMEFGAEKFTNGEEKTISIQYYNFPGQIQKESKRTVTFDEIINIFDFLPALQFAHVILLMYDTNRIYSLKSLENWVKVALEKKWITENTLVVLISNKIDLQPPNDEFVSDVRQGILQFIRDSGVQIDDSHVVSRYASCKSYIGVDDIRQDIISWIANHGMQRG